MAYVAVDKDGAEWIYSIPPVKDTVYWVIKWEYKDIDDHSIELPKGSIKKLIGRELTWDDEPVELK